MLVLDAALIPATTSTRFKVIKDAQGFVFTQHLLEE